MILGGAQPEGYVYIGTNQGRAIRDHADIVQASMTHPDGQPRAGFGDDFWGGVRCGLSASC
jgi:hypothetical protein